VRVVRTFAFLDLCGFSAYSSAHGDDLAVAVIAKLRSCLRAAAESRGVRVTKWLGDGAMLSGLDAESVVACVVEARDAMAVESPLPLRVGVASGPAIMFEGEDYLGFAVNTAARLCSRASPNQVLITSELVDEVGAIVSLRALHAIRVSGICDPVEVREVAAARTGQPDVDHLALVSPPRRLDEAN
jgi:adenylate cyclase